MRKRVLLGGAVLVAVGLAGALLLPRPVRHPEPRPDGPAPSGAADQDAFRKPPPPVRAELLADVSRVLPGTTFRLGVLLTMQPGWHVFWKNSGESGEPTEIALKLPERFDPGPLQWPVPTQFTPPGGGIGYGYRDRVLLQSEVRASNLDLMDQDWHLAADGRWLACERDCVPGRATVELWLPHSVSGTRLADLVNAPRFDEWLTRVPLDPRSPDRPFTASVAVGERSAAKSAGYLVSLQWHSVPSDVEWFPFAGTAAAFQHLALKTEGRRTEISFASRTDGSALAAAASESERPAREIAGVIAYADRTGARRAAELSIALERPSGKSVSSRPQAASR